MRQFAFANLGHQEKKIKMLFSDDNMSHTRQQPGAAQPINQNAMILLDDHTEHVASMPFRNQIWHV